MEKTGRKKTSSNIKSIVIAVLLVGLILFYFNYLSDRTKKRKTESEKNELSLLMEYNVKENYPKTARDVIKLHNRYYKVFFSQSISDEDLELLCKNVRYLYSEELLSYNPENAAVNNLKNAISSMNEKKYKYKTYELPEASQIKYYEKDGAKLATAEVKLNISINGDVGYMYIQYVLINEDEKWKIMAWGESKLAHEAE